MKNQVTPKGSFVRESYPKWPHQGNHPPKNISISRRKRRSLLRWLSAVLPSMWRSLWMWFSITWREVSSWNSVAWGWEGPILHNTVWWQPWSVWLIMLSKQYGQGLFVFHFTTVYYSNSSSFQTLPCRSSAFLDVYSSPLVHLSWSETCHWYFYSLWAYLARTWFWRIGRVVF